MELKHLLSPMKVGNRVYRNRIVSAPMAFGLIVQDPDARDFTYRKLEGPAAGGNACVIVGETDVNFVDAVRIPGFRPFDFAKPEEDMETFQAVAEYATRIKRHDCIALAELVHCGKEKVPFGPGEECIGPVETVNIAGVKARPMTKDDMDRIANDFATAAVYMQRAGFDGVLIHGGHGFLFTQFLSPLMNTRTDEYGGSLENRARFPKQILKTIREAVGPDFLIELRIDGDDHQPNGIRPDETGQFVQMVEEYITSVHITCGIYDDTKSGVHSSMFQPHGLNVEPASIVKKYTKLPVGVVGGLNSPEFCEEVLEKGLVDFFVFGRQMLADPCFANKCKEGRPDTIRRCLRCYYCFPGSPEEGYDDLPFTSEELAMYVGHCTINPLAHLPFDPAKLPDAKTSEKVLVAGGGPAGLQAAITAADRGHDVTVVEKSDKLGGLLWFTDVDVDKPDLRNFKDLLIREAKERGVKFVLNTEVTPEYIKEMKPGAVILATGSVPATPPVPGIEHAIQALEVYAGAPVGHKVVMVGGGLVGCETGLHLQKTGHEVTVIDMLDRVANESFGMYRDALVWEMEKTGMVSIPKTKCLEIKADSVKIENADGVQTLLADTVIYALGMKSVCTKELEEAAKEIGAQCHVIGDAIQPAKVDRATRTAYLAAIEIGK